jgi:putative membrane protein
MFRVQQPAMTVVDVSRRRVPRELKVIRCVSIFVVATVLIIAWALRASGFGWQSDTKGRDTPLDTLKQRFARGEIDRAEYEERRKLLVE